jgi:hypothetical protein
MANLVRYLYKAYINRSGFHKLNLLKITAKIIIYTFDLLNIAEEFTLKIYNPLLILLTVIFAGFAAGCAATSINPQAPVISSLVAEHTTLYPLGNTTITCSASSPVGAALKYRWVCSDGTIINDPSGNGSMITYEAPKTYGDFYIMATVDDDRGKSANKTVTVTVIVRDPSQCCR